MKKNFTLSLFAVCFFCFAMKSNAQWNLTGNANTTASSILGTTNAIPLNLTTNNVQRLVIDANGKIGIGTSTPVNILTVKGTGSTPAASWINIGAPLFVGFGETTQGNADYLLAMASANKNARPVFIGRRSRGVLSAPTVVSDNDFLMSILASGFDGSTFQNTAAIDFYVDGVPTAGNLAARVSIVTGTNSTNRAERLKVGSNGDVTVTTGNLIMNAAAKTLQFANPTTNSPGMMTMFQSGTANNTRMVISHSTANPLTGLQYADSINQFNFVDSGVSVLSIPRAKTSNTPASGLSIFGTPMAGYAITVGTDSARLGGIIVSDTKDNTALNFTKSGVNYGALFSKTSTTSGVETIYSSNAGSGAGISASSVNSIGVSGYSSNYIGVYGSTGGLQTNGDYAGYFSGAVNVTGGYFANSDRNLKKNIQDVASGLSIIRQLRPKHYEFKDDGDFKLLHLPTGTHYGLIAQDVEKVLPEMVGNTRFETSLSIPHPTEEDVKNSRTLNYKSLNYNELIPILVKGIQEQQEVIEKQQQQIDELKDAMLKMVNQQKCVPTTGK